ncbi:MAG TPA: hypothetical protein VMU68_02005 [Acidimicrobiales bacterium]|nr:hypothetical protein [Acidimicrobiales bacterium]
MNVRTPHSDKAERFIEQLRRNLRHARRTDRDDYIAQIADHIRESRADDEADDPGALDALLNRIGEPSVLANAFYAAERVKLNEAQRVLLWVRRWWIGLVLVAVLATVTSFLAWASTYQPLSLRSSGEYSDTVVALSGKAPIKLTQGNFQPAAWKLTEGHYRLSILFPVDNLNSLAVNISPPQIVQGFPLPESWHLESIHSAKQGPFKSAHVEGKTYREIVFSTSYVCRAWPTGNPNASSFSTQSITDIPIVMSFWGFQHTLEVRIQPFTLEFAGDCFGQ